MLAISQAFALALLSIGLLAGESARETGIAAFKQGRYSVALKELKQAATDPNDRVARVFLGLTEAALGECKTALPGLTVYRRPAGPGGAPSTVWQTSSPSV